MKLTLGKRHQPPHPDPAALTPPAQDLHHARTAIDQLAAQRRARGHHVPPEHVEAAAALLADLWVVVTAHGITPDQPGHRLHLPRAALDTITAARKRRVTRSR